MRAIDVLPVPRGPAKRYAWRTESGGDRVLQRPDDRLLPDDLVEALRAVFAVERGHDSIQGTNEATAFAQTELTSAGMAEGHHRRCSATIVIR